MMQEMRDVNALELHSQSPEETERFGARLGALLAEGEAPLLIALEGELGAGKTRFVRGLAAGLGVDPSAVASPTFILAVEHAGQHASLVHVDAWRLRGEEELETLGWSEWLQRPRCVIAVEWASRIASALPARRITVRLDHAGEEERRITIEDRRGDEEAFARLRSALTAAPRVCPRCGGAVAPDAPTAPFCSSRCRNADLSRWFRGEYRISRPLSVEDEESETGA